MTLKRSFKVIEMVPFESLGTVSYSRSYCFMFCCLMA